MPELADAEDAERFYRDAKITEVYEGTKETHTLIIARPSGQDRAGTLPRSGDPGGP